MGSDKNVVCVFKDRGYAVMQRERWNEVRELGRWAEEILACTTWGEYRLLGPHPFEDFVWDSASLEEDPDDDDDFPDTIPLNMGGESGWDYQAKLEIETQYFLETVEESDAISELVESCGPWSWIELENVRDVVQLLIDRGYDVTEEHA